MTWRERTAQAESHKILRVIPWARFTEDDHAAWCRPQTCVVGEAASQFYDYATWAWHDMYMALIVKTDGSRRALNALCANNAKAMSRLLDEVEDAALEIKRGF